MPFSQDYTVDITNKEIINVEVVDKSLITVEFYTIDTLTGIRTGLEFNVSSPITDDVLIYESGMWTNKPINLIIDQYTVHNEIPTPLTPVLAGNPYITSNAFRSSTLEIFLNGVKLLSNDYIILSSTTFSIGIDTISTDVVSVNYIKE